jgi:hypothetical protein
LGQEFALNQAGYFIVRLLQRFNSFSLAPDFMPAGSLPPAHWAGMPGRQGVEKIHPAINFTMHSKVRAGGGLLLQLFSVFDAETANPLSFGISIYRVAFGYLPNPRLRRHLKFPLRLLLPKRPLPPRWRRPRLLGELFLHSRAGLFHIHMRLAHDHGRARPLKKESQGNEKTNEIRRKEAFAFWVPFFLVCRDD